MSNYLAVEYLAQDKGYRIKGKISLCWVYQGALQKGYGSCGPANHLGERLFHRYMYKKFVGQIPEDKQLDHLCPCKACGRPSHLEPVTNQINQIRAHKRNKHIHAWKRKLSDKQVRKIKRLLLKGFSCTNLGKLFCVDHSIIRCIYLGKTYKHVK